MELETSASLNTSDLDYQPLGLLGVVDSLFIPEFTIKYYYGLDKEQQAQGMIDANSRVKNTFPDEVRQLEEIRKLPEIVNDYHKNLKRAPEYEDIEKSNLELLKKVTSVMAVMQATIMRNYRSSSGRGTELEEYDYSVFGRYIPLCANRGYGILKAIVGPESIVVLNKLNFERAPKVALAGFSFDFDLIPIKSVMRFKKNE